MNITELIKKQRIDLFAQVALEITELSEARGQGRNPSDLVVDVFMLGIIYGKRE